MLTRYITIALRLFRKKKTYTLINLTGLVIGITLFFLIALWVKDEFSYDRFIPHADRTFRIESTTLSPDGTSMELAETGWPIGRTLQEKYEEVEKVCYMRSWNPVIKLKDVYVREPSLFADENFFDVFGYDLKVGNPQTALKEPYTVVISQAIEEKYFGKGNGFGKLLMVNDTIPHRVTGVFKELPSHSHLKIDLVGSFSTTCAMFPEDCKYEYASGWFDINVNTYVRLKPNVTSKQFENKIKNLVGTYGKEAIKSTGFNTVLYLRPVQDIYLYSGKASAAGTVGNIQTVYVFITIGIFILLIACLNFINLSTARAIERAKEVGIKKVLGTDKKQLIVQFLIEAGLLCTIATLCSLIVAYLTLSPFNYFTNKNFTISTLLAPDNLILLVSILIVLIPLTGFYPAWILSNYQPVTILKGSFTHSSKGNFLRKSLVVTQFTVSICLIIGTLIIWQQLSFMKTQSLGFDKDKIVVVDMKEVQWTARHQQAKTFKKELSQLSSITSVTGCRAIPGRSGWDGQFAYGEGLAQGQGILVEHIPVDYHYLKTIGLKLIAGRDFIQDSKADSVESYLINETAMKAFGWNTPQNALDKKLSASGMNGKVIGVIKDYHQHGLQEAIRPVIMNITPSINVFAIRYSGNDPELVVTHLKKTWQKIFPAYSLDYKFLDDDFQQQYQKEEKLIQSFSIAAILAIVIACLGLFGLATYAVDTRTKEIGIRKVLGASVTDLVSLLSKDFLLLVLIALVVATPLAFYVMNLWLQDFAYRVSISGWVFILAGITSVLIAMLTISYQSIKAALDNPVKSLRNE
ncbi:ABC transporter permease [Cytophagaceae bacterium DM2B3-1]|uniref:ABC transporter permease n=1 Tax=Xanthocytophaga flava TaxID=3048013 RepID=A0ABT7CEE9_9BACT|nr:FtsX-like permease family protein [Xanthocytophaga flavus]MDJ1468911.1 ABC transporter permease [Xanthocytophaga flavus]MDJ1492085.1 ABC transporter permease [Xanthocytophaga flavus]